MNPELVGALGIVLLLFLFALGMPIGIAMLLVGFLGYSYLDSANAALSKLGIDVYATASSYVLSVIPLFILMGMFLSYAGLGARLYRAVDAWLGHLRGGMAMATIGACAAFAAVCGSTIATAATMAKVALPEMKRYGYKDSLATACVAAGGTLGILIPPSVVLVLYGMLTHEPVGELLVAGILPGLLLVSLFMGAIYIQVRRNPTLAPLRPKAVWKERVVSSRGMWPVAGIFLLVMGGLFFGVFTPTEAGAIGACTALLFALAARSLNRSGVLGSLDDTARTTAMIFLIVIGATVFAHFLAISRIPSEITEFVAGLEVSRYVVLAFVFLLLVFLGFFLEGIAILVLTVPILYPIMIDLGFDGLWFGVIMVIALSIGLVTPPVGMNVYVTAGVAKDVPIQTIFRGVVPLWLAMVVCAILLIAFPQIVTSLPSLMS